MTLSKMVLLVNIKFLFSKLRFLIRNNIEKWIMIFSSQAIRAKVSGILKWWKKDDFTIGPILRFCHPIHDRLFLAIVTRLSPLWRQKLVTQWWQSNAWVQNVDGLYPDYWTYLKRSCLTSQSKPIPKWKISNSGRPFFERDFSTFFRDYFEFFLSVFRLIL